MKTIVDIKLLKQTTPKKTGKPLIEAKSFKASSPSPDMRRGSPFKKSVAGKSNPKPFGMGRAEFHAFTYQGQVGGTNKKVVKSKSFVSESGKPIVSSKPRRNSLPPKLKLVNSSEKMPRKRPQNKYSHITSKTDSGIRAIGTPASISNSPKSVIDVREGSNGEEITVAAMQSTMVVTCDDEADKEVARIDSVDQSIKHLSDSKATDIFDCETTAKSIAMGVIRVCSPDIPVFYAALDKGKTSPTFSEYDQEEPKGSPGPVDEEDVSICKTPDIEVDDISEQINKCWSLECNHVSGETKGVAISSEITSGMPQVRKIDSQFTLTKKAASSVTSHISPLQSQENKSTCPPGRRAKSPDSLTHASRKSPASETAESSIFVDSMLTTIYSGEEYTNREATSRNTRSMSRELNDENISQCNDEESGLEASIPSLLSVTAQEISGDHTDQSQKEIGPTPYAISTSPEELKFPHSPDAKSSLPRQVASRSSPASTSLLNEEDDSHQRKTYDEILAHYQTNHEFQEDDYIEDAVKKLNSMVEDNSEHSMSLDEYFRAFSPLYSNSELFDHDKRSPSRKSSPLHSSRKSSPASHRHSEMRLRSGSRSKSASPICEYDSCNREVVSAERAPQRFSQSFVGCRTNSSCTFNDAALDEEIRRIETKCSSASGSESDGEPLSETLGRVEFVLDEITKMGTRIITKAVSRQSEKSSISSSPLANFKINGSPTPISNVNFSEKGLIVEESVAQAKSHEKMNSTTSNEVDMSRILSKIDQVKDDVRKEKAVLKTTIRQTHDLLGFQSHVSNLQISSTPDIQDSELELWRKESFELLREHEAALQKILKYERKLDKLRAFMKAIARKRSVIETRIQSRMSVNAVTPKVTPRSTPRTGTPVKSKSNLPKKGRTNRPPANSQLTAMSSPNCITHSPESKHEFSSPIVKNHTAISPAAPTLGPKKEKHLIVNPQSLAISKPRTQAVSNINKSSKRKTQDFHDEKFLLQQLQNSQKDCKHISSVTKTSVAQSKPDKKMVPAHTKIKNSSKEAGLFKESPNNVKSSIKSQNKVEPSKKFTNSPKVDRELEGVSERLIRDIRGNDGLQSNKVQTDTTITRPRDLLMQLPKYEGPTFNTPIISKFKSPHKNVSENQEEGHFMNRELEKPKQPSINRASGYDSRDHRAPLNKQNHLRGEKRTTSMAHIVESRKRRESDGSTSSAITISSSSSGVTLDEENPCKIDRSCIVDKYLSPDTSTSVVHEEKEIVHGVIIGDKVLVRGRKTDNKFHDDFLIETRQFHNSLY